MKFIIGPCVIESKCHALKAAKYLKALEFDLKIDYPDVEIIYKSSYRKTNRTQALSPTGVGLDLGMSILKEVREIYNLRTTTDVHNEYEAFVAGQYVDIIQIPHSLCRHTDIIQTAAKSNKIVSVKKGTFMTLDEIPALIEKIRLTNNDKPIILIDRGEVCGPGNLVVDMRNFRKIKDKGFLDPTILCCIDATHSAQDSRYAKDIALAGVAAGADMVFIEAHFDPKNALCDGKCMLDMRDLNGLLRRLLNIKELIKYDRYSLYYTRSDE